MTSLYGQYIKEREGIEIIENDFGYITYRINDNKLHVLDLFIVKEARNNHLGFKLCKELEKLAKDQGCSFAMATVTIGTETQDVALKFHIDYGMKLISASNEYIVLGKEI